MEEALLQRKTSIESRSNGENEKARRGVPAGRKSSVSISRITHARASRAGEALVPSVPAIKSP
jgi:hypothetical protein